ncbi:MAG: hypothetical protein GEU91_18425 [Rhizobiales bacterium]|nr:hypothetical protein [Hyphomicrobiales bacterium]
MGIVARPLTTWGAGSLQVRAKDRPSPRTLADRSADRVNALDFRARADGVELTPGQIGGSFSGTDNRSALQAGLDAAGAASKPFWVPPGRYRLSDPNASQTPYLILNYPWTIIIAHGAEFLLDDEDTAEAGIAFLQTVDFNDGDSDNRRVHELFEMHGGTIGGRWSHFDLSGWNPSDGGRGGIRISETAEAILDGVKFRDIRGAAMRWRHCDAVKIKGCDFERIGEDGGLYTNCNRVSIWGNSYKWCADDPINVVSANSLNPPTSSQVSIFGNNFFQCNSLLVAGARNASVIGNNFLFSHGGVAIRIGGSVQQDSTAPCVVTVQGNTIENTVMAYNGTALTTAGNDAAGITVFGEPMLNATTDGFPGFAGTAGVVDPQGKDSAGDWIIFNREGSSRRAANTFNVSNNVVTQTQVPTGAVFSDFGYGPLFYHTGFVDPTVSADNVSKHGVSLRCDLQDTVVSGNVITGMRSGAGFFLNFDASADVERAFENVLLRGNTARDCLRGVATSRLTSVATPVRVGVTSIGNTWDCDPYHVQATRAVAGDGTWQSGVAIGDRVLGVAIRGTTGWSINGDTFANCYEPVLGQVAGAPYDQATILGCVVACDPVAVGFDAGNKGVATVLEAGRSFVHEIRHSDPTDAANFGMLKNICPLKASAMPSAGTFVRSHFVEAENPTVLANRILKGWLRLTTGTAHVLDSDWRQVFELKPFIDVLLNDDTAVALASPSNGGMLGVVINNATPAATRPFGFVAYRSSVAATAPVGVAWSDATNVEYMTGVLSGTTGNDGKLTFSCNSDGNVYIENRLGANITFRFTFIGV